MNLQVLERPKQQQQKQKPRVAVNQQKNAPAKTEFLQVSESFDHLLIPLQTGLYSFNQSYYINALPFYLSGKSELVRCTIRNRVTRRITAVNVICLQSEIGKLETTIHQYFPRHDWQFLEINYTLTVHKITTEFD